MNEQNKKTEPLGSAPVPKALLSMGISTMIGMLINALYSLADAYFVSGLGERQIGAVTVVYLLGQVIVGLGLLFGNGAASYISRLLGRREELQAQKAASTALYGSLSLGAVIIIRSVIFLKPLLRLLGATDSILPYALTYILSCIFNVFNVTMNNLVTSEGAAKTTMCALLTGAVLNIALDPLSIYGLELNVAGAAIATAISQIVSTAIYILYILKGNSIFRFRIKDICISRQVLSEIFKIGIPTLIFQLLGSLTVFGFIKGFQPIAGYSYGAKHFRRLRSAIKLSILWSTIFCVVFGGLSALFSTQIISAFTEDNLEMIRIGSAALRTNGMTFVFFGLYTVYSSLFLALGK